jgi:hypothetical protein
MSETNTPVLTLEEGQTYRWWWKEEPTGQWTYWCKSNLAIVKNGRLYDTYWSSPSNEHELNPSKVNLTLLCDSTWTPIQPYHKPYYKAEDVVDTRHANNSSAPVWLRPGAVKDPASILAEIERREADANSDIRMANWRLDELRKERDKLEAGSIDEVRL